MTSNIYEAAGTVLTAGSCLPAMLSEVILRSKKLAALVEEA